MPVWLYFLGCALTVAVLSGAFVARRRRQLATLNWPVARSHFAFARLCRDYLAGNGWAINVDGHGAYDLAVTKQDIQVTILCRKSGWQIGPDYLASAMTHERQWKVPIVIVTEDRPSDIESGSAAMAGASVIHYSRLPDLERIAQGRRESMEA